MSDTEDTAGPAFATLGVRVTSSASAAVLLAEQPVANTVISDETWQAILLKAKMAKPRRR